MFCKPAPGRLVRDPLTKIAMPEAGANVPDDGGYWSRRLRDGDIVLAEPVQPAATPAPNPPAEVG
jgi:hypothetical protein